MATFLLAAVVLLIPWVKFELRPSIGIAEVVFVLLIGTILLQSFVKQPRIPSRIVRKDFVVVLFVWLIAVLCSGFMAPYPAVYFFDAGGMLYLCVLSMVFATIAARDEKTLRRVTRVLIYSVAVVTAVGAIGIIKAAITGQYDLFFHSTARKLIATFMYSNQLAGFLVLFLPLVW